MTSNIGFEKNAIGFNKMSDSSVINSLKNSFSTAFVNRIDNVLVFNRLNEIDIESIIRIRLDEIKSKHSNIKISYSDSLISEIVSRCEYYDYGARNLEKIINRYVENIIIDAVINNDESIYIESLDKEKNTTLM